MARVRHIDAIVLFQRLLLFPLGLAPFSSDVLAQLDTNNCVASEIQPEAIDLDQPPAFLAVRHCDGRLLAAEGLHRLPT